MSSGAKPAAVAYADGLLTAGGGTELFRRSWCPPRPTAALMNVHGLGDHSGLYAPLAETLAGAGLAVHGIDLRGHGRSPGQRAYVERWDDHLDDLDAFGRWVTQRHPDLPLFLMGHSLGALISLDYAIRRPGRLAGVIAVAPPLGEVGVPPVLMIVGRLLARVWPRFSLNVGMDLSGLSRTPGVVEAITTDPLFHRMGTARLAAEVPRAIARVHERAGELTVPLLLLHGLADRMVPPAGTQAFHARVADAAPAALDVQLRLYEGAYHALFFDEDGAKVTADLLEWIGAHA